MFFERYGIVAGIVLLVVVSSCAWLLARKAARQIAAFREADHQRFTSRRRP